MQYYNLSSSSFVNPDEWNTSGETSFDVWYEHNLSEAETTDRVRIVVPGFSGPPGALSEFQVYGGELSGATSGDYVSSIFDANVTKYWANLSWSFDKPSGTNITVRIRAGSNQSDLGDWSDKYTSDFVDFDGLNMTGRYIQYKIDFSTNDSNISSALFNVTVHPTESVLAGNFTHFIGLWRDQDSLQAKMFICTTNSATASGCSVSTYCSAPLSSEVLLNCSYETAPPDNGTNMYYAFVYSIEEESQGVWRGTSPSLEVRPQQQRLPRQQRLRWRLQ
jgi:hypothetical protein